LISGYGPWLAISEGITTATSSIVSNHSLVKNLAFKVELLPIAGGLMGVVPLIVAMVFLMILIVVDGRWPELSWLLLVPAVVVQFLLVIGVGFFLSAINVFVRDVSAVLPNVLLLILFFSPIFYPVSAFPSVLQKLAMLNPFYIISEMYREPLLRGTAPSFWSIAYGFLVSLIVFLAGLRAFRRLKPYFDSRL